MEDERIKHQKLAVFIFEHFEENKAIFNEEMKRLRMEYDRLLRLKRDNAKAEAERDRLITIINKLNEQLETQRAALGEIKGIIEQHRRTEKYIENYRFSTDGAVEEYIQGYRAAVEQLLQSYECFNGLTIDKVPELIRVNIDAIKEELSHILSEDNLVALKSRQTELRNIMQGLRDPDTDEAPQEGDVNYAKYKEYQGELITIGSLRKQQKPTA